MPYFENGRLMPNLIKIQTGFMQSLIKYNRWYKVITQHKYINYIQHNLPFYRLCKFHLYKTQTLIMRCQCTRALELCPLCLFSRTSDTFIPSFWHWLAEFDKYQLQCDWCISILDLDIKSTCRIYTVSRCNGGTSITSDNGICKRVCSKCFSHQDEQSQKQNIFFEFSHPNWRKLL